MKGWMKRNLYGVSRWCQISKNGMMTLISGITRVSTPWKSTILIFQSLQPVKTSLGVRRTIRSCVSISHGMTNIVRKKAQRFWNFKKLKDGFPIKCVLRLRQQIWLRYNCLKLANFARILWIEIQSWPRSDHKTKGEWYRRTPTHSQRTIGSTRSRREKNPTDATYVGSSGRRKTGSGRRRDFPNKVWVISNILAKTYQQDTSMLITNVGDWSMGNWHG